MIFLGADTEQLRDHAQQCTQGARSIEELIADLQQVALAVTWQGPDAERFREAAMQAFDQAREVAGRITESSEELNEHADEQDHASDSDGAGDAGGSAGENATGKTVVDDGTTEGNEPLEEEIPLEGDTTQLENADQGGIADCYLLSAIGAIAQQDPDFFNRHVEEIRPGVYRVKMYDADGNPVYYEVQSTPANGARLDTDEGEQTIYSIYEQAYQMHLDAVGGEDTTLGWGVSGDAMQTITGQDANYYSADNTPPIEDLEEMIENGRPITAGTGGINEPSHPEISGQHEYKVSEVDAEAGTVTVVNPWGGTEPVTMTYEEYKETFGGTTIGRTKNPSFFERVDERFDGTWKY